jgi:metallophosphoesterase superfamily enzyme
MDPSVNDNLAAAVVDLHCDFEQALAGSRKRYPRLEFDSFAEAVRRYVDATRRDKLIHRDVIKAVHRLVEYLRVERKRVPDEVLVEAERLECLLFNGYDPYFEGNEPPGL